MSGVDPRPAAIPRRLAPVARVVAVTGGKGGIGKSSVASVLALELAAAGRRTGLLDLDLTAPSDHVVLGVEDELPSEEFGVEPPEVAGVHFMSVHYFLREHAAALRGDDVSQALLELLAITHWPELDVLVLDMPPGLGDVALDAARWLRGCESLVVASGSRLVVETARRMLRLLATQSLPVIGVVENFARGPEPTVRALAESFGTPFAGAIPYDDGFEAALGDPARLRATAFAAALRQAAAATVPRLLD